MADGPYDVKGCDARGDGAALRLRVDEDLALTAAVVLGISRASAIRFNGRVLSISPSYLS